MPRVLLIAGSLVGAALALLWLAGAGTSLEAAARDAARMAQDGLARAIRALRAGEPGALAVLLGVAFGYGLAHAAGPGHGKLLIGGYALARRSRLTALAGLALMASLAQVTVAVALVLSGAALFDLTRAELARAADVALPPFGHAAIAALGIWLVVRGVLGYRQAAPQGHGHGHDHGHDHGYGHGHGHGHVHHDHCAGCGHRHGPTAAEVAALTGWRDAALLVAGIALRPCAGTVFLLVLTWQAGILPAGIVGAYAMGLGTAAVTMTAAALAVWAREGAFAALPGAAALRGTLPAIETAAGVAIAATGLLLLAGAV